MTAQTELAKRLRWMANSAQHDGKLETAITLNEAADLADRRCDSCRHGRGVKASEDGVARLWCFLHDDHCSTFMVCGRWTPKEE